MTMNSLKFSTTYLTKSVSSLSGGKRNLSNTSASKQFRSILQKQIDDIRSAGTYKNERIITSSQSTTITVQGSQGGILNFCANNYLGLSNNQEIVQFSKQLMDSHGCGLSSVRFICGTQDIHKTLESKISQFHGREDTILYASCFDANAGIFEAILTPDDAVFSDELNHASIIDGIRLCKAKKSRYQHRNMEVLLQRLQPSKKNEENHAKRNSGDESEYIQILRDLEQQLKESNGRIKMIVTDGVFSMDGNVAPLPDICKLADKYNALVFVDECHATGFFGETGRGTEEFHGILGRIDIINSTLGKALGGASGGYTTGPKQLIDLLRQKSRPYLFSNSLPPAVVGTGIKVIDMLLSSSQLSRKVQSNTKRFRTTMIKAGFTIAGMDHPISPVMLFDAKLASTFADEMLKRGIYVIGFSFPVVPKDKARIRVQISAAHTEDEIDRCTDAFIQVGKQLGVI